jgi:hypothetical protein
MGILYLVSWHSKEFSSNFRMKPRSVLKSLPDTIEIKSVAGIPGGADRPLPGYIHSQIMKGKSDDFQ